MGIGDSGGKGVACRLTPVPHPQLLHPPLHHYLPQLLHHLHPPPPPPHHHPHRLELLLRRRLPRSLPLHRLLHLPPPKTGTHTQTTDPERIKASAKAKTKKKKGEVVVRKGCTYEIFILFIILVFVS